MRVNGEPIRVAFQGEPGAFSEDAAAQLLGDRAVTLPQPTFEAAFASVAVGLAQAAVVPIENSLAGSVLRVYDLLLESDLTIAAETIVPVELHLIACPGAKLAGIRSVESHPMALAQCERLFAAHRQWARVAAEDTAGSVRQIMQAGDPTIAAIASELAGSLYDLKVVRSRIEDQVNNFTRFLVISKKESERSGNDKTSILFSVKDEPGILCRMLEPFAKRGINLSKIESRPYKKKAWEYIFFLDLFGHTSEPEVAAALDELKQCCQFLKVLGSFPRSM